MVRAANRWRTFPAIPTEHRWQLCSLLKKLRRQRYVALRLCQRGRSPGRRRPNMGHSSRATRRGSRLGPRPATVSSRAHPERDIQKIHSVKTNQPCYRFGPNAYNSGTVSGTAHPGRSSQQGENLRQTLRSSSTRDRLLLAIAVMLVVLDDVELTCTGQSLTSRHSSFVMSGCRRN